MVKWIIHQKDILILELWVLKNIDFKSKSINDIQFIRENLMKELKSSLLVNNKASKPKNIHYYKNIFPDIFCKTFM